MPELPEVETVCQGLRNSIIGTSIDKIVVKKRMLRFALPTPDLFENMLTGHIITNVSRRAKYICIHLSNGHFLVTHLGMSGNFFIHSNSSDTPHNTKHTHIIFYLSQNKIMSYRDIRRFGYMDVIECTKLNHHRFFMHLGVEPFATQFTQEYLYALLQKSKIPIKNFLLDQKKICGIGNIYANEILWHCGIHPHCKAYMINEKQCSHLVYFTQTVLQKAIKAGGSTLKDFVNTHNDKGYFQHHFQVYNRGEQKCLKETCNGHIKRIITGGRSSYFCSNCQKNV